MVIDAKGEVHKPARAKGGEGMSRALEVYKEEFPEIEAILIGTRRTDPHGCKWSFSFLIYTTLLPHSPSLRNTLPIFAY